MTDEDEAAFVAFVTARRSWLRRLAYAICGDWSQADDLVQTALSKLYLAWPRMRHEGGEDAYVRRILVRSHIDNTRRPWRREAAAGLSVDRAAPVAPDPADRITIVAAMQRLPVMQRKVVVLRYFFDLSVEATALELRIRPGTVKSHSARALASLQRQLSDAYSDHL